MLNHDALIEGALARGAPLVAAAPLAVGSWLVMVAAMMLPASWPAIARLERAARRFGHPGQELASFLTVFGAGWAMLGLLAFAGDAVLHRLVDATPWLAARPWLVQASILGLAAAYQLSPVKRRCLEGCRTRELAPAGTSAPGGSMAAVINGAKAGWAHLLDCVGASGPLMVLVFAAGFADLAWMAGLSAVMVYEARGSHGETLRRLVAAGLAILALLAVAG
jgi:predicted metal-binding membrane protein